MKSRLLPTLGSAALLCSPLALAQVVQPGLWEVSPTKLEVGGQAMPGMQAMLERLNSLPPEQRQMMEEMLARQGVALGAKGVRMCLTPEQVEADNIPLQSGQGGCTNQITERSAKRWAFRFTCPNGSGVGETLFNSDREFVTRLQGQRQRPGQAAEQSSMEYVSRWLGADCGEVPPRP
ncbi:MAG: DUF3617 domain-containing protein [Pseudomonas sp.]